MLHVGSAPSPGGLSGLLASPEQRQQAALGGGGFGAAAGMPDGLHRVASEGTLIGSGSGRIQQQQQLQPPAAAAAAAEEEEAGWPAASAFTTVSRVYSYRTVVLNWRDPRLPGMLRPIIQVGMAAIVRCCSGGGGTALLSAPTLERQDGIAIM